MTAPEWAWSPPNEFEEYRLIRSLGQGGMGQVYLAEDRLLARLVAVKFIAASSPSESARERFFVEARAVARLSHPNVVAVHRVGEIRRRPYLVSEYVRGQTLAEIDKPVPWRRALAIAIELARGLAAAHRRGVLHRDIKPANAMISEDGTIKLLDFGLAELLPWSEPMHADVSSAGASPEAGEEGVPHTIVQCDPELPPTVKLGPRSARAVLAGDRPGAQTSTRDLDVSDNLKPHPPDQLEPNLSGQFDAAGVDLPAAIGLSSTVELRPAPEAGATAFIVPQGPRAAGRALVGTPAYMAPEIWNGEPPTQRADVYALGVVIYELCFGVPPHSMRELPALIKAALETDALPLEKAAPGVDPRFATIVDRCLRRDASLRFSDADALREALEQIAAPGDAPGAVPEGNPYRGLFAFEAEHRSLFFGRNGEILAILDRLRADPVVVVAGDSGTGKSSLCRAGVLPAVAGGTLGRSVAVIVAILGRHPLSALAAAIAPLLGGDEDALLKRLRAEPAALARDLKRRHGDVLLFIDQLEELCIVADPREAAEAADALHGLAWRAGGVRLIATARSDFLTRLSALPGLGDDLPGALYLLRPLTVERLREAVTGPAAAKGFSYESDAVVEALVSEALRAEGGLPLLQFALAEVWEARDRVRKVIPASALEAIGGVTGALARHADGVLARLRRPHRRAARAILLALITTEGTRAQRLEAELLEAAGASGGSLAALDALVRGRLLVACEAEGGEGSAYMIAHEALLAGWDTLRGWLGHDVEGRALRQRLERAAAAWERGGRAANGLWGNRLVTEAAGIDEQALGAHEMAFLIASRRAARWRRIARWTILGLPVVIGLALVGARVKAANDLNAHWKTRALLTIETSPPGASVVLERFVAEEQQWVADPSFKLDMSPISTAPGSVILEVSAPDRAVVRLPMVLEPGKHERVTIDLPLATSVPAGFIYVPQGRFLYGSSSGEDLREFFDCQPMRSVETPAYLIAQDETTYAEWIEFLSALSPGERRNRTIDTNTNGFTVALTELPDGNYKLFFGLEQGVRGFEAGQKVDYSERDRRKSQDWLRFPVMGVSFDDLKAYAAWKDRSGSVPGARPCTEQEWERAARGADGRAYPGGERLGPDDANFDLTYGRASKGFGPDEVGSHPRSDSPFGVHDMAGNVWEWTSSTEEPGKPVARGGSFFESKLKARAENRGPDVSDRRDAFYGIRICATPRP